MRLGRSSGGAARSGEGCPPKPAGRRRAEAGSTTYVYILQSIAHPAETYSGLTEDLRNRLKEHNAGESAHTRKYMPWRLVTYLAFSENATAIDIERYLKTASGRAFANKRLR